MGRVIKVILVASVCWMVLVIGRGIARTVRIGRQRQTLSTLYRWGAALDVYAKTHGHYPRPGFVGPVTDLTACGLKVTDERGKLQANDGWGNPILYHGARNMYALRSTARDGINDHQTAPAITDSQDADIVYANGTFMRVPEAICGGIGEKDDWDVKKYGECAECHPRHVRPRGHS